MTDASDNPLVRAAQQRGMETVRVSSARAPVPRELTPLEQELAEERRRAAEEDAREELEEMREERRRRREIRRKRSQLEMEALDRRLNGEAPFPVQAQPQTRGDDWEAMLRRFAEERAQYLGRIDQLTDRLTNAQQSQQQEAVQRDIAKLRDDLQRLGTPGTTQQQQDPFAGMMHAFDQVLNLRKRVDDLVPQPPPTQQLDEVRRLELEIQGMDRQIALETVKERRESIQADRDKAIGRMAELMDGVRDVVGPALMGLAQSGKLDPAALGRLVGIGGGNNGAQQQADAVGAAPAQGVLHYRCPSCKRTQTVPEAEAQNYHCAYPDCRYGPVAISA